jgi:hypothetical protein
MNETLEQRLQQARPIAEDICNALSGEVIKMGLARNCVDPDPNRAEYSLNRDPGSGEDALIGIWRDAKGQKQGEILFHVDGSYYAEYDVICEHPKKPDWFIEAVIAWGRDNVIKSEPKLLPWLNR